MEISFVKQVYLSLFEGLRIILGKISSIFEKGHIEGSGPSLFTLIWSFHTECCWIQGSRLVESFLKV